MTSTGVPASSMRRTPLSSPSSASFVLPPNIGKVLEGRNPSPIPGPSEPARVIRPKIVDPAGDEASVPAIGLHHPDRGRPSGLRAAERDAPAVRGLARPEVPDRWV